MDLSGRHGQKQRQIIERLGTGGRFAVAVGSAGAGKSTMLKPLVAAWQEQGREVYGVNLATRHADQLTDTGIAQRNTMPFVALVDRLKSGELTLTKLSVVAIDEFAMLGTRQGLELLRAQARFGFSVVALGDDKQIESITAGAIVDLSRRALGAEQIPEIVTTVRQQTERERTIAGLFRQGRAAEALDMKRADGTAEMVAGGYEGVVSRVAKLYADRLRATGRASDDCRADEPGRAQGQRGDSPAAPRDWADRRKGSDDHSRDRWREQLRASACCRRSDSPVRQHPGTHPGKGAGNIGRNGSVLEVVTADQHGITLKSRTGTIGKVAWTTLEHKGRTRLAYGDVTTIHTAQGSTSREHILALPSGSTAIDGKLGYSGNTRHRHVSYLLTKRGCRRRWTSVKSAPAQRHARDHPERPMGQCGACAVLPTRKGHGHRSLRSHQLDPPRQCARASEAQPGCVQGGRDCGAFGPWSGTKENSRPDAQSGPRIDPYCDGASAPRSGACRSDFRTPPRALSWPRARPRPLRWLRDMDADAPVRAPIPTATFCAAMADRRKALQRPCGRCALVLLGAGDRGPATNDLLGASVRGSAGGGAAAVGLSHRSAVPDAIGPAPLHRPWPCQGWGRGFESLRPLQSAPDQTLSAIFGTARKPSCRSLLLAKLGG